MSSAIEQDLLSNEHFLFDICNERTFQRCTIRLINHIFSRTHTILYRDFQLMSRMLEDPFQNFTEASGEFSFKVNGSQLVSQVCSDKVKTKLNVSD